jgi:hypothetical protein
MLGNRNTENDLMAAFLNKSQNRKYKSGRAPEYLRLEASVWVIIFSILLLLLLLLLLWFIFHIDFIRASFNEAFQTI